MAESTRETDNLMPIDEPEVEIEDVYEMMRKFECHLQESAIINGMMQSLVLKIRETVSAQEQLNEVNDPLNAVEGNNPEKLSSTALKLILKTEGILNSCSFSEFLMCKSFRKPFPPVLPILRVYSRDVQGVKKQLIDFKKQLRSKHVEYKEERRKDSNLERRIEKLIENIDKELRVENRDGLHQTSIENFVLSGS